MSTVTRVVQNSMLRLKVQFLDVNGDPVDPTTTTISYKNPAGAITSKVYNTATDVVRTGAGAFYHDLTFNASGTWYYSWAGTGAAQVTGQKMVVVDPLLVV